ncbi:protein-glutamine gamma-glutamyltransferase 5-like [Hyla sarda]|uniref:protein-glutamine gamma-glutamyltransferase 5-like n=1 Tax=Hyla sarda TaxID=327740 RepID=UPI0024C45A45|nr:protein-glutamine gamma-glutamyltransferase 5-like [Hyla sarda]
MSMQEPADLPRLMDIEHSGVARDCISVLSTWLNFGINEDFAFDQFEINLHKALRKINLRKVFTNISSRKEHTVLEARQQFDLCIKDNNKNHQTDEITTKRLIVRRGQDFKVYLQKSTNGGVQLKKENITFVIESGTPKLRQYGKTKAFGLSSINIKTDWNASVVREDQAFLEVKICSPADGVIGLHTLNLHISDVRQTITYCLGELVILFNAWCPDDAVFLPDQEERKEFVMNENGFVFVGNADYVSKRSWNFGQFEEDIIDVCLTLLDESLESYKNALKDYTMRNDPVYVSRVLSAMINCNDDNGVMLGRWDGKYDDGTSPTKWNGSCSILRQWYLSGFKPVKYGQCWVFAAVLCTALRCLGIPARVITNFDSAHDTDGNLSIDEYYDDMGKPISSGDSIWNFHVWNECWMLRKDLPPGYNGWQALDATPQETSNGIFCCGPAPVKAIKEGDIHLNYDCPFIFAEVNADVIKWIRRKDKTVERLHQDSTKVGKCISTKQVGSNGRMDVTSNYKYAEGSEEERLAFKKALDMRNKPSTENTGRQDTPDPTLSKIGIQLRLKLKEPPVYGQDVQLIVLLTNLTSVPKPINININVQAIENNGAHINAVYQKADSLELKPQTEHSAVYLVPYSLYKACLTDSNLLKVSTVAEQTDTHEKLLAERNITLDPPELKVERQGNAMLLTPYKVTIRFANPLTEELRDCGFVMEGNGLVQGFIKKDLGNLKPGHGFAISVELIPYKSGKKTLQVLFASKNISNIREYMEITVLSV